METLVITGANRGIGLELTRRFLAAGDKVIATARDPKSAIELMSLSGGPNLRVLQLEVTDASSVESLHLALGMEPVDMLINNAGVMGGDHQAVDDMDFEAWRHALEVNTLAPFRVTSALLPNLKRSQRPRVMTLSSQMGSLNRSSEGWIAYRSSKAAVNKVMQVMALELEGDGVIVCPVHPGWVRTDMGGNEADISVEESAEGLERLLRGWTMEHSGRFWTWQGEEHPW